MAEKLFQPVSEKGVFKNLDVLSPHYVPDELPHASILKIATPYLGKWISKPHDWTPLKHYTNVFKGYNKPNLDPKDPWQFKNFLVNNAA